MERHFLQYSNVGLACLPVRDDKSPAVPSWLGGVKDKNLYVGAYGIAIACGDASGNLECMDFDNHFGDANQVISDFVTLEDVKELFNKYKFTVNKTQGGGYHILYKCSTINGNKKLASKPKWNEKSQKFKPDAIIETRGQGGYFVAPPTEGYKTFKGTMLTIPEITPEEREVLFTAAMSFNEWVDEPVLAKEEKFVSSERIGDTYDNDPASIREAEAALEHAGWTRLQSNRWRRPDKDRGISATFGVVAPNCFYCFTSNGYPFKEMTGYSPFQIIGLLDYNGDFKQLAKDLGERYNTKYEKVASKPKNIIVSTPDEMEDILRGSWINTSLPMTPPPTVAMIREDTFLEYQRFLTLGNFSAITGKAKAKKTFAVSMITAAMAGNRTIYDRIKGTLPKNKQTVLRFDTEQSKYDAYRAAKLIESMIGFECDNFHTFDLREHKPKKRIEIIEFALNKYKDNLGYVVIDGIADLANSINDDVEATEIVSHLMRWTAIYNCHISAVIHQNKGDNYATGHLGSTILKKAEMVISVDKVNENKYVSEVSCSEARGVKEFSPFTFGIDDDGVPVIYGSDGILTSKDSIHETNF